MLLILAALFRRGLTKMIIANTFIGLDEGLHIERSRHGGSEQEGRIPRNRGVMPKRLRPYCTPTPPGTVLNPITGRLYQHCQQMHKSADACLQYMLQYVVALRAIAIAIKIYPTVQPYFDLISLLHINALSSLFVQP